MNSTSSPPRLNDAQVEDLRQQHAAGACRIAVLLHNATTEPPATWRNEVDQHADAKTVDSQESLRAYLHRLIEDFRLDTRRGLRTSGFQSRRRRKGMTFGVGQGALSLRPSPWRVRPAS